MTLLEILYGWLLGVVGVIAAIALIFVFIYVAVRVGGIAWYQSRMEHIRRVLHITGDQNEG